MDKMQIQHYQVITEQGQTVTLEYDQEGDILEIFFEQGPASCALELADPLILRFDRETGKALSLSVLTFSKVAQVTEFGPHSFRLHDLESLPSALKEMVIHIITTPPVSHFLEVIGYYPQTEQRPIPISYIKRSLALPIPA